MGVLKNYCRSLNLKTAITVGVIGYPNVGKSSLINSLKRCALPHNILKYIHNTCAAQGEGRTGCVVTVVFSVQVDRSLGMPFSPGAFEPPPSLSVYSVSTTAPSTMKAAGCINNARSARYAFTAAIRYHCLNDFPFLCVSVVSWSCRTTVLAAPPAPRPPLIYIPMTCSGGGLSRRTVTTSALRFRFQIESGRCVGHAGLHEVNAGDSPRQDGETNKNS